MIIQLDSAARLLRDGTSLVIATNTSEAARLVSFIMCNLLKIICAEMKP